MTDKTTGFFNCRNICWIVGGVLGLIVFLMILPKFFWALVIGVVVAVALALILQRLFCTDVPAASGTVTPAVKPDPAPAPTAEAQKPEPKPDAKPEPVKDKPAAAKPAPKPEAAAPAAQSEGPELLDSPREGGADDLKMIKGVGPGLEKKLNDAGVYHFDQIAKWGEDDVAAMDDKLSFRGRITRDDWIGQAKALAAGEETEFSQRASKGLYEKNKEK